MYFFPDNEDGLLLFYGFAGNYEKLKLHGITFILFGKNSFAK
jgi:hypothetical protein